MLLYTRGAIPDLASCPGWDVGIVGMKAGGERELTIPASMGYGKRKMSDIPPNSTLKFGRFLLHAPAFYPETSNSRGQTRWHQLARERQSSEGNETKNITSLVC